jgi:pyruvate kinase
VAARYADLVGLSCAQSTSDVHALQRRLAELCASHLGVLLKIGTRRGFENLPELLFAAMSAPPAGVMVARGELAVECGFERLAEVQEEVLRVCEAAHMPAVWATQVLADLAKAGRPSRCEITDAAMEVRADCVMLDEGPHILDAMRTLDDILRRLQMHPVEKQESSAASTEGPGVRSSRLVDGPSRISGGVSATAPIARAGAQPPRPWLRAPLVPATR